MRGETEKSCLGQIKKDLQGLLPYGQRMVCSLSTQNQSIHTAILAATPNVQNSSFPDFVFDSGFIEHFQVTAAKEDKKGSNLEKAKVGFKQESEESFRQLQKELEPSKRQGLIVKVPEMTYTKNSYDSFVSSFKKNWEHHIKSLEKYTGEKRIGIFLIENNGATFKQMRDGMYLGALYHLHLDKTLLPFIYEYRNQIQCVIFKNAQFYEIVETKEIPRLLNRIPQGLYFEAGRITVTEMQCGVVL